MHYTNPADVRREADAAVAALGYNGKYLWMQIILIWAQ